MRIIENNNKLETEKEVLKQELKEYQNGKLYKFITKIYKIKGAIRWKKR